MHHKTIKFYIKHYQTYTIFISAAHYARKVRYYNFPGGGGGGIVLGGNCPGGNCPMRVIVLGG